jgi:hypothetical protein
MFAVNARSRVYTKRKCSLSRDFVSAEAFCYRCCKIGGGCSSLASSTRFALRKGEVSDSENITLDILRWGTATLKTVD